MTRPKHHFKLADASKPDVDALEDDAGRLAQAERRLIAQRLAHFIGLMMDGGDIARLADCSLTRRLYQAWLRSVALAKRVVSLEAAAVMVA